MNVVFKMLLKQCQSLNRHGTNTTFIKRKSALAGYHQVKYILLGGQAFDRIGLCLPQVQSKQPVEPKLSHIYSQLCQKTTNHNLWGTDMYTGQFPIGYQTTAVSAKYCRPLN